MTSYVFEVPGKPVPWQRVRRGKNGSTYVPKETQEYERRVAWSAKGAGVRPIVGPVRLEMVFYVPDLRPRDGDNLQKAVMDGLKGVGYADDKQVRVWSGSIELDRENPRAVLMLAAVALPEPTILGSKRAPRARRREP